MPKLPLPAYCLPFVTRVFRGGRRRRFAFFSGLFGVGAVLMAFWLALGSGPMEQELRVALDLEQSEWQREQTEYMFVIHGPDDEANYRDGFTLASTRQEARTLLGAAIAKPTLEPRFIALQDQARALLATSPGPSTPQYDPYFEWHDEWQVQRVEAIVANELQPRIIHYASPLGVADAFSLLGFISGGVLILLGFVFGPLTVGVQQAQEVHENTLQPLTGTALTARQLTLGLASGPLAVVGLFALPHAALFMLAGITNSSIVAASGLLLICVVGCVALSLAAQLLGHMLGRRRTPGVVGASLLVMLGGMTAFGMGVGLNLDGNTTSALTLLPQGSAFYLLHTAFANTAQLSTYEASNALSSMAVGGLGLAVLCVLLLLVVERKIAARSGAALERSEALVGLLTATIVALITVPYLDDQWRSEGVDVYYLCTLALLAPCLALLVMSRVPLGDMPASLRRVPVKRLLGELAVAFAIHLLAVLAIARDPMSLGIFHPVSIFYLVWCAGVLALLSIRAVAYPVSILSGIWLAFCCLALAVAFGHAAVWANEADNLELRHVFALSEASPILGLIQVGLTAWIPISLVRALRKNLGGLS